MAIKRKQVVPALSEKQQLEKIKEWKKEEIETIANLQSRALSWLSGGKIYMDISEKGLKLVIPDNLKKGFGILMDLVNPEDITKRMSVREEKLEVLNSFFKDCGLDLIGKEKKEDNSVDFEGKGTQQLAQFMKSCIGYQIEHKDLF